MKPFNFFAGVSLLTLLLAGCAQGPSAQQSKMTQMCDSDGCRMVDITAPQRGIAAKKDTSPKMKANAYRGENLQTLDTQLAEGDADAGYKLATVYEKGLAGVSPNIQKAVNLYEQSAQLGSPAAARAVAVIYLGQSASMPPAPPPPSDPSALDGGPTPIVPKTMAYGATAEQRQRAISYLYTAAEGGDAIGMMELGKQLYSGGIIEKDPVAASAMFELAAEEGVPEAKYYLGQMYFRGIARKQNGYQAIKWTRDAAMSGSVLAQRSLGQIYINGYETVGRSRAEADRWLSAAAQNGDPESAKLLELLRSGRYMPGGTSFTTLMPAGDIVRASKAAMRGIEKARIRLDQGGSLTDPITIEWDDQPTYNPGGGQTTVAPAAATAGANCYIIEHTSRVEGRTQERTEKVCQDPKGGYTVAI